MIVAFLVLGSLAQIVAWTLVAAGRGSVWTTVGPTIATAAAVAVVIEPPALSGRVPIPAAAVAGIVVGAALYLATAVFVAAVGPRWPAFARDADAIYRDRGERPGVSALGLAGAVAVGEELFWRGAAQTAAGARVASGLTAAILTLIAYVAVNAPSRNLAIVAGALVGGAVWGALAWWTAGVLGSLLGHAVWIALMLVRPVAGGSR
jgi:membrane protease YdiL (CAAX protease family)